LGLKDYADESYNKIKSRESINQLQSMVQTIYNIVKSHGSELKAETKEGQGSEFKIVLPIT
jgi:signal transduction histidine kinase